MIPFHYRKINHFRSFVIVVKFVIFTEFVISIKFVTFFKFDIFPNLATIGFKTSESPKGDVSTEGRIFKKSNLKDLN